MKTGKFSLDDIECKEARYRVQYLLAHPELDKVSHVLYDAALRKYQNMIDKRESDDMIELEPEVRRVDLDTGPEGYELDDANGLE